MKILFATSNKHKIYEAKKILGEDIDVVSLEDLNDHDDVEEDGSTFEENSFIKAKYYYDKYHLPVISDDSGLCCDALDGRPGIFSARYSGGSSVDNINKLLSELKDKTSRSAFFYCSVCYIDSEGEKHFFSGKTLGMITEEFSGENGFGYDPVFYSLELGKTFGKSCDEEKNSVSHRGKALNKLKLYLSSK